MRSLAEDPRLRAVGEIGLDFYWKDCPPRLHQEEAFRVNSPSLQKRIALVIHSRDAERTPCGFWKPEGFLGTLRAMALLRRRRRGFS